MIHSLEKLLKVGQKVFSETVQVSLPESKIAKSLGLLQKKFMDLSIGSYPFFQSRKVGVAIVLRGYSQKRINICKKKLLLIINKK